MRSVPEHSMRYMHSKFQAPWIQGTQTLHVKATSGVDDGSVSCCDVEMFIPSTCHMAPVLPPDQLPVKVSPSVVNCQKHFSVATTSLSGFGVSSPSYENISPIRLRSNLYYLI